MASLSPLSFLNNRKQQKKKALYVTKLGCTGVQTRLKNGKPVTDPVIK